MTITNLPDELLVEIIDPVDTADAAALSTVSRRFHGLSTGRLYRDLELDFVSSPSAAVSLHRTLSEKPSLRAYCRVLQLRLPDPDLKPVSAVNGLRAGDSTTETGLQRHEAAVTMAAEVVSWTTGATHFSLDGHFVRQTTMEATWDLILSAVRNMPNLEKLSLGKRYHNQVWMERVGALVAENQAKRLRTLEIGVGVVEADSPVHVMTVDPSKVRLRRG